MKKIIISTIYILLFFNISQSNEIKIFEFTDEEMKILKSRKIKGETTWILGSNEKGNFIKGEAEGKASGLGIEKKNKSLRNTIY